MNRIFASGGPWKRGVHPLRARAGVANGAFGENLIVEGVFCKVLERGRIALGDPLGLVEQEG